MFRLHYIIELSPCRYCQVVSDHDVSSSTVDMSDFVTGSLVKLPKHFVLSTFIVVSRGVATLADTLVLWEGMH